MLDRHLRASQVGTWNLTLERQFAATWLVRAAYVGNKGTHLFGTGDQEQGQQELNPAIYIPGQSTVDNEQQRRPNPFFSTVGLITSSINSNYNAFQLTLEKRFSRGLSLLSSYTWSRELNDFAPVGAFCCNTNPFNRAFDYGPSDDLTHAFKLALVYQLPRFVPNGWAKRLTNAWTLSSITTWQSGFPFTVFSGFDNSLTGIQEDQADFLGANIQQAQLSPERSHTQLVQQYFNTSLFAPNAIGTFGDTGKNALRDPGLFNTDIAVMKNTQLSEHTTLQLRGEAFNIFNNVNFFNPDNILTDSAFGQITAARAPRILQLAVKILF